MSDPLLKARRLSRAFGDLQAVDKLSFEIPGGQVWGFIGPNGAGKTTTMRILATLDLPDRGNAWIDGVSVLEDPASVRKRIGFMSDQFAPYGNLTVHEYLDFFARACGLVGRDRLQTVRDVAGFCQLTEFRQRPANRLSKGMGQRLHLAKTLLHDPRLLILDEPASGLDPRARIEFRELIRTLADDGKGVFISSHILAELSETCDGVVVIERGKLVVAGTIAEVARFAGDQQRVRVETVGTTEAALRFFAVQPQCRELREHEDSELSFAFDGDRSAMAELLARATAAGIRITSFRSEVADLESIFMRTTSGRLH
ncbi:MAG: ABC transporter ATP-binding protein [Planctomycetes bacterium]|nr:ABC transporter ATP-binding protein [Planctomycetota bacterium]